MQRRQIRPPRRQVLRRRRSLLPQQLQIQPRWPRKAQRLRPASIPWHRSRQDSHRVRSSLPSKRHHNRDPTHRRLRRSGERAGPRGNRRRLLQRSPRLAARRMDAPSLRPRHEPLGHRLRNRQRLRRRQQPALRMRCERKSDRGLLECGQFRSFRLRVCGVDDAEESVLQIVEHEDG